jgi:hypothetical protein
MGVGVGCGGGGRQWRRWASVYWKEFSSWDGACSTHAGLIRFVLVDKKMDRFYLEESLYTVPVFSFSMPLTDREEKE